MAETQTPPKRGRGRPRKHPATEQRDAQAPANLASNAPPSLPPVQSTEPATPLVTAETFGGFPDSAPAGLGAAPERPDIRGEVRDESPRAEAERIAADWFAHLDTLPAGRDKYYVDPRTIPDAWSYEWKTYTVVGKENPQYHAELLRSGWRPVPASRHPELMPNVSDNSPIMIDGMMLMERPAAITDFQRSRAKQAAEAPVKNIRAKLSGAPAGTFERGTDPRVAPTVKTEWASPVPRA